MEKVKERFIFCSQAVLSSDMCEYLVLSSAGHRWSFCRTDSRGQNIFLLGAEFNFPPCQCHQGHNGLLTDYDSVGKSHVMSWINLVVDSFQFVPKKCGNQSAFCELYVSQSEEGSRLGDDLGCASSGWWARARRWQPLTRQAALNFTTADCSANGSVPVVSRWACCESALFIFAKVSQLSLVNELGKDDDTEKVQIWCRRKSPDKMTCWEVANWTELLYWGCLKLVSWLLKRSKKPRRRKNALEGRWEGHKQDVGCWTFTCSAK